MWRDGVLKQFLVEQNIRSVRVVNRTSPDGKQFQQAWCGTDGGGVVTLRDESDFRFLQSRFDVEQGLPSQNAFAVLPLEDDDGETIFIGTSQGLAIYTTNRAAPLIALTRFGTQTLFASVANQSAQAFRVAYPQRDIAVEVAGLSSRTFPQKLQYGFILRDAGGRIVHTQLAAASSFQVDNLTAGRYGIEARAFGIDLRASPPLVVAFDVEAAPFPATTLALSVLLALALGALWWGARQNFRLKRTGRELVDARFALATEAEAERRRIARDLHDQTLADLRRLLLRCDRRSDLIEPVNAARYGATHNAEQPQTTIADVNRNIAFEATTLRHEVEAISTEVRRICEDLSPSVLENVGLAAALRWLLTDSVAQLPAREQFTYDFTCDEDFDERVHFPPAIQIQIYRILQEALSNICRHAHARHVHLTIFICTDDALHIALEDDGAEFDFVKVKRGRGLIGMLARANLIEAQIAWTTRDEGGTRWTLTKAAN